MAAEWGPIKLITALKGAAVKDFPLPKAAVTLKASQTPQEAHHTLLLGNVQSAPVWDDARKKWIGMLDMRDLVDAIVWEHTEPDRQAIHGLVEPSKFVQRMLEASADMRGIPHSGLTLLSLVRRQGFQCLPETATLEDVTSLMVQKSCHRVAIVNGAQELLNIISQSVIIKFLNDHMQELGDFGKHSVGAASCGTSPVLTVKTTSSILDAFRVMATHDITGVAVVDDDGKLVSSTSANDLKEFLRDPTTSLELPVVDFIAKVRQRGLKARHSATSVEGDSTMSDVIATLATAKGHRLYVTEKGKPRAVVSLTDILRFAYNTSFAEASAPVDVSCGKSQ